MVVFCRLWIFCLMFIGFVYCSDTLWCYQCGDSSATGSCITDTAGMEAEYIEFKTTNSTAKKDQPISDSGTKTKQYKYLKNCQKSEYDRCVIERIEEQVFMLNIKI